MSKGITKRKESFSKWYTDIIAKADLAFIDTIGFKEQLSQTRANGLVSMIKEMKLYALAYQNK